MLKKPYIFFSFFLKRLCILDSDHFLVVYFRPLSGTFKNLSNLDHYLRPKVEKSVSHIRAFHTNIPLNSWLPTLDAKSFYANISQDNFLPLLVNFIKKYKALQWTLCP